MAENAISVAFEATADTAKAEGQMASMGASIDGTMQRTAESVNATAVQMSKTIAESLKQAGATAEEAALGYKKLGLGGEQAGREIAAAFGTAVPVIDGAAAATARTGNQLRQAQASAMILERQFGIHMPRAINAMLARSELIGPLLQGAFAIGILMLFVEHMDKVIGKIREAGDWLGGFTKIYKDTMAEAVKFTKEAGENIRQVAEKTAKALYGDIRDRELRAKREREFVMMEVKAAIDASDARIKATNKAIEAQERLVRSLEQTRDADAGDMAALSMGAPLRENRINQLRRAREESQKLANEVIALTTQRNKDAAALRDVADQAEKAEDKKAKAAESAAARRMKAERAAHEHILKLMHDNMAAVTKQQEDLEKLLAKGLPAGTLEQMRKQLLAMMAPMLAVTNATKTLTAAERAALPSLHEIQIVRQNLTKLFPQMSGEELRQKALELAHRPVIQGLINDTRNLRQARQKLLETTYQMATGENYAIGISEQWRSAIEAEIEAMRQHTVAGVEGIAVGVAGLIAGRRAQAAVEGAFDAAMAIQMWARFIGSWGTDVPAGLAAAKYTIAAVEMFKIAGGAGGGGGGGGAAAYAGAGMGGYGGESRAYMVPRGAPAAGAAGGTTINITVQGGVVGARDLAQFVGQISQNVQRGTIRLISSATLATPVTRT